MGTDVKREKENRPQREKQAGAGASAPVRRRKPQSKLGTDRTPR